MSGGELDKQKKFSVRDIIWLMGLLATLGVSYLTNQLSAEHSIDTLETKVTANCIKLEDHENRIDSNEKLLPVMNYKLDLIMKELKIGE